MEKALEKCKMTKMANDILREKFLHFEIKKFQKLADVIDKKYIKNSLKRLKEQMRKRENGTPSKRRVPRSPDFGYELFVKEK